MQRLLTRIQARGSRRGRGRLVLSKALRPVLFRIRAAGRDAGLCAELCAGLCAGLCVVLFTGLMALAGPAQAHTFVVGSKRFTESYILGELVRLRLQEQGLPAEHRQGLGNTAIVVQALKAGRIDVYPEYTGTILREILQRPQSQATLAELNAWLAPDGLKVGVPLGFNNSYALALRADRAAALGLRRISDLAALPAAQQAALRTGFSAEFTARADGWPGLRERYGLQMQAGRGLDHGLAYAALQRGEVDLVDAYSTDAAVHRLGLVLLEDDLGAFPRYDAVLLMRLGVDEAPLQHLAGRWNEAAMAELNGRAERGETFEAVARSALAGLAQAAAPAPTPASDPVPAGPFWGRLFAPDLPRLVAEHAALVLASTGLAVLLGLPLGIAAQRRPRWGTLILGTAGLLQTVPSLALLAALIAALGRIGTVPALIALFLYAMLPVVSATQAALSQVPPGLRQAGLALGLRPAQVLWQVELALARPVITAGVGTAAVTGVGTATVAAFVGAGGLGERIVAGLAVNDAALMMAGAVPAAVMALAVQALFKPLQAAKCDLRSKTGPV
jgi:osmoprotectant transport system permease protein